MKVVFIRAAKAKGYLKVRVSSDTEDTDFVVSDREYADAGAPRANDNLTREAFSALKLADMRYRARLKAMRVLAYGDNSERMLVIKLQRAGISRAVAEETARDMVMRGYINNVRQLERLISYELSRLNGPKRFIPKLMAKGYSRGDIEIALDELSSKGDADVDTAREALLEKYSDSSYDERAQILYKHGF